MKTPAQKLAYIKAWRKANPEKRRAYERANYARNSTRIRARKACWRKANPQSVRETQRKSNRKRYQENPDYFIARAVQWGRKNKAARRAIARNWKLRHPEHQEEIKARQNLAKGSHLKPSDFPQSLVNLQIAIQKNKRLCRNQKTSTNSETNS